MSSLRVMLVDDHRVVRDGLRMALEIEEDIGVVGEAGDGMQAVKKAMELKPDLILMDIIMPGMNGIDACQEIRNLLPECRVVMLTASADQEAITGSLLAGAKGYILKAAGRDDLLRCIRAVARGDEVLDPAVTRIITEGFRRWADQEVEQLTPREREILLVVSQGLTNRQIAEKLVISEYTARNTVSNVLGKLGLKNRSELVRWAIEHRVVTSKA